KVQTDNEHDEVVQLGGLYIVGTERHESRRIDNQLRGRAGRQGDPGSSQFFVSTEDELVRRFGGDRLKNIMDTLGVTEDDVIENRFISSAIQQAQGRIEGHNFDVRKYVLEYDDVMNKQRSTIYGMRRDALLGNAHEVIERYFAESENPDELREKYIAREKELGGDHMKVIEKLVLLRTIDELWVDHLTAMDYLRSSVSLRAYGQRDPLAEYKVEGQRMFIELLQAIKFQVLDAIFKVTVMQQPVPQQNMVEGRQNIGGSPSLAAGESAMEREMARTAPITKSEEDKIGRNDPCPCGSGKKWKKCGMLNTHEHQRLMAQK
ncbi:MAG TPA: SEC-C metal-binding domain-containing protein, partial [Candidatus Paceibacterota bacterium]|nr:SEC-C metal-binding domain-containing protein [Candidatus Paceibacterota bacterium]